MDTKLRSLGGVEYTAEERAWAAEIAKSFGDNAKPLDDAAKVQPYAKTLGYGSTDVGDVSWATPTVGLRAATWVPGTSAHSWQAVAASGSSIGFKGAQLAAKAGSTSMLWIGGIAGSTSWFLRLLERHDLRGATAAPS